MNAIIKVYYKKDVYNYHLNDISKEEYIKIRAKILMAVHDSSFLVLKTGTDEVFLSEKILNESIITITKHES